MSFRSRRAVLSLLAPIGALSLFASAGKAVPISFDGSCGNLWHGSCTQFIPPLTCICRNNWNTGEVVSDNCNNCPAMPNSASEVFIGSFNVVSNNTISIASLTCMGSFTNNSNFTASGAVVFNGAVSGSGTYEGTGHYTFNGLLTCTADTSGPGFYWPSTGSFMSTVEIPSSSGLQIYSTVLNQGTINWRGSVSNFFIDGSGGAGTNAILKNLPGGLVLAHGDGTMRGIIATGYFENRGTLRKDGASGTTNVSTSFMNKSDGVIDVRTGTMRFDVFGTMDGTATISAGAVLQLDAFETTVTSLFNVTGAGKLLLTNELKVNMGATMNVQNLHLSSAGGTCVLSGPGTINVSGTADISGRTTSPGLLNLQSTCQSVISSNIWEMQVTGSRLNNSGSLVWTTPTILIAGGASINNLAGGTWDCQDGSAMGGYGFQGTGTLTNAGTFKKTAGAINTFELPVVNNGLVLCSFGTLAFTHFVQNSGETRLAGGTLSADFQIDPIDLRGGKLTGSGNIRGPIVNTGAVISPGISPGSPVGLITSAESFYGSAFTQSGMGAFEFDIAGFAPGTEHDQFAVSSDYALTSMTLGGKLKVRFINGFAPTSGFFDVITYHGPGVIQGMFDSLDLPSGMTVSYMADRVRVNMVINGCQPADIADDAGNPLPSTGINNGVNEGDYNAFFQGYFNAEAYCDHWDDAGNPLPSAGVNNGVNEGDYNGFFTTFFNGCP